MHSIIGSTVKWDAVRAKYIGFLGESSLSPSFTQLRFWVTWQREFLVLVFCGLQVVDLCPVHCEYDKC